MRTLTTAKKRRFALSLALLEFYLLQSSHAFLSPLPQQQTLFRPDASPRSHAFRLFALPEVKDMKIKDIRSELESYGINTKIFLEKSEFVNALEKARAEGLKPKTDNQKKQANAGKSTDSEPKNGEAKTSSTSSSSSKKQDDSSSGASRAERLKEETEKAKAMRVSELKEKLKSMGVNTKSFFEKTEFVRAYAEAVVDGVKGTSSGSKASSEEPYDPEYRDVVVQKFDPQSQQRYLLSGTIIDVKLS